MFSLYNKIAVITGGGSGIGRAISTLFAKQGAEVHILDLAESSAKEAVSEITASGFKATAHTVDICSQSEVIKAFQKIGRVDILVNNAGIAHIGRADTTNERDFINVFDVNVRGTYNCLFAVIPQMKVSGGGVILNMASIAAWVGISDRFAYSMSKGAIHAMTMSVARDYISDKIRCNSISPARIHTPFVDGFIEKNYPGQEKEMFEKLSASQPAGRMGKPEEVAALALYLCSSESGFVTGCDYPLDGGFIKLNN